MGTPLALVRRDEPMLKITPHTDAAGRRALILEGQVAGRWVQELRSAYAEAQGHDSDRLTLDLRDVTFIDASGVAFFHEVGASVSLVNCSLFAAEQLKDLMVRHQRVQA
jgi:anti-anti-sigma regulatory factor